METKMIFEAISKIMNEMDAIPKSHVNQGQKFKYRSIDDLYNFGQKLFAKHGVFTVPQVQNAHLERVPTRNGEANRVIVRVKFIYYAKDGSFIESIVDGEAIDSGDKATSKAMAIAHKYSLFQTLMVATEDLLDPDAETHEVLPKPTKIKDTKAEHRVKMASSDRPSVQDLSKWIVPVGHFKERSLESINPDELFSEVERATKYLNDYPNHKDAPLLVDLIDKGRRYLSFSDVSQFPPGMDL